MKNKILLFAFIFFISAKSFSQVFPCYYYTISFEGTGTNENANCHWMYNDTISNPASIWQIGPPQKIHLSSALSLPNVLITDTINTYPTNDTSSFILGHSASLGIILTNEILLRGHYYVNSDTLTDNGTIEFSPNNGTTWIDLLNPLAYASNVTWNGGAPVFSGNSHGWKSFWVDIYGLNPAFNIHEFDTCLWRFTFKSDGIETFKDGLMFDSLDVIDSPPVGIENKNSSELKISTYPNPSNTITTVEFENSEQENCMLMLYDSKGGLTRTIHNITSDKVEIDLSRLQNGIYFIRLLKGSSVYSKKISKE